MILKLAFNQSDTSIVFSPIFPITSVRPVLVPPFRIICPILISSLISFSHPHLNEIIIESQLVNQRQDHVSWSRKAAWKALHLRMWTPEWTSSGTNHSLPLWFWARNLLILFVFFIDEVSIIVFSWNVYYEDYIKLSKVFNKVVGTQDYLKQLTIFALLCNYDYYFGKAKGSVCLSPHQAYRTYRSNTKPQGGSYLVNLQMLSH